MHDGPGIRTTVFFKGCPLRCEWCHNPETKSAKSELMFYSARCIECGICASCENGVHSYTDSHIIERELCTSCGKCAKECPTGALDISGRDMTAEEIFSEVMKDAAFYGDTGGVTLSGGEPLVQADGVRELLRMCKASGIGTAVETSGHFDPAVLSGIVPFCDIFLWDVKCTNSDDHIRFTGVDNTRITENLHLADALGAKTRLRCILVNGVNTNEEHYSAVTELFHSLKCCEGVELLPYHSYGASKSIALGVDDPGRDEWIPSAETVSAAKEYMRNKKIELC